MATDEGQQPLAPGVKILQPFGEDGPLAVAVEDIRPISPIGLRMWAITLGVTDTDRLIAPDPYGSATTRYAMYMVDWRNHKRFKESNPSTRIQQVRRYLHRLTSQCLVPVPKVQQDRIYEAEDAPYIKIRYTFNWGTADAAQTFSAQLSQRLSDLQARLLTARDLDFPACSIAGRWYFDELPQEITLCAQVGHYDWRKQRDDCITVLVRMVDAMSGCVSRLHYELYRPPVDMA